MYSEFGGSSRKSIELTVKVMIMHNTMYISLVLSSFVLTGCGEFAENTYSWNLSNWGEDKALRPKPARVKTVKRFYKKLRAEYGDPLVLIDKGVSDKELITYVVSVVPSAAQYRSATVFGERVIDGSKYPILYYAYMLESRIERGEKLARKSRKRDDNDELASALEGYVKRLKKLHARVSSTTRFTDEQRAQRRN